MTPFKRPALFVLIAVSVLYFYFLNETIQYREAILIPEGEFIMGSDDMDIFYAEKNDFGINDDLFFRK